MMMSHEHSDQAAELASRIKAVDRELDQLEKDRIESISLGMRMPGLVTGVVRWGQETNDTRREDLLQQRRSLVDELKTILGDT